MSLGTVQQANLTVSIVLAVASSCIITLRIYDRRYSRRLALALDDYTIMVSLVFVLLWTVSTIVWVSRFDLGTSERLTTAEYRAYGIVNYINRLLYACGFDLAKIAIILFYIKLTDRVTQTRYWRFLVCVLVFMVMDWILHFLVLAIPCVPVSAFYDNIPNSQQDNCLSSAKSAIVVNTFTFISEALIVLAPIPLLWLSGLTGKQRVALGFMFSLGVLIVVASALKLRSVIQASTHVPSYELGIAYIWLAIEMNVAVLVAGFLPLKALLEANFLKVKRRFSAPHPSFSGLDAANTARRHSSPDMVLMNTADSAPPGLPDSPYSVNQTLSSLNQGDEARLAHKEHFPFV